jgi:hypothetical protein
MYGVPAEIDLSPFSDTILEMVSLGQYQITLHFNSEASITIEGAWELADKNATIIDQSLNRDQQPSERESYKIHACIGQRVIKATAEPPRSILLNFENGYSLRIIDDSEQYESFHIQPGDIHI